MSSTIFDLILVLHAVFALAWLGTLLAGLSPTLKLYTSSGDDLTFRRGMMIRRLIAGTGGIAILMGLLLYYYITAVAKSFAPSSVGTPLVAFGAVLGAIVFILSTYKSRSIQAAFRARIEQTSIGTARSGTQVSMESVSLSNSQKLPSKNLLIMTPIILIIALLLMAAGSMM